MLSHRHHRVALAAFLLLSSSAFAAQRTFVSTGGTDLNVCSLAAPCRGFAKAITVTDVNGEIVVLDSGGYGAVTVNKNVTITSPAGVYGGISVFAGNDGITIVAPAAKVVLRGLTINGQGGDNGIRVQAGEVHIESSVISNMEAAGIRVEGGTSVRIAGTVARSNEDGLRVVPGGGAVSVLVRDSEFSNNGTTGIGVSPSAAGANAQVTVERTSVTKNGAGLTVATTGSATATVVVTHSVASENAGAGVSSTGAGTTVFVRESAITRNNVGLAQASSGVLNACGANLLVANNTAQSGAINTTSCLDVASGSGTVTSVAAGTGLTGGTITGTGTIGIANLGVGNAQLANGAVDLTKLDTASTDQRYFKQNGNPFGIPAILGTTDNFLLDFRVNGTRVMRYQPNTISANIIGGSPANNVTVGVRGATIAGGGVPAGNTDPDFVGEAPNRVTDSYGTVSGGFANRAGDDSGTSVDSPFATVSGGTRNTASGSFSTVGGGFNNTASGQYSIVGGGLGNTASGYGSTVGGGDDNTVSTQHSTVGGGHGNTASDYGSTVGGGEDNTASGQYSIVGGGILNTASGFVSTVGGGIRNIASGSYSIAGGDTSEAAGDFSIALGRRARTVSGGNPGVGTIVFADSSDFDFIDGNDNRFSVRATGGVRLVTGIDGTGAPTWSCQTSDGNGWNCSSDRNLKQDLALLDGQTVLGKVAAMPIYQWQPQGKNAHIKHYGPMAQDFHAAFGLGDDDKMIGMQDADGVALAAIQGLNAKLEQSTVDHADALADRDSRIAVHARELEALRVEIAQVRLVHQREIVELKHAVEVLLARTSPRGQVATVR